MKDFKRDKNYVLRRDKRCYILPRIGVFTERNLATRIHKGYKNKSRKTLKQDFLRQLQRGEHETGILFDDLE